MFWAHCKDCEYHWETRRGEECPSCRSHEVESFEWGVEHGCRDCQEIAEIEERLARARKVIAAKTEIA